MIRSGLVLVCRTGAYISAIPIGWISETMRPAPISPLADLPPYVLGVAAVRGQPTPVIDAGELMCGARQASPTRFVILKAGERRVALAVDAVLGTRALPGDLFEPLAPLFSGVKRDLIQSIATLDGELLIALEAARLLPEPVWAALESAVAR